MSSRRQIARAIAAESFRLRFASKVRKTKSCWIWTASRLPKGYGKMPLLGHAPGWILAHRAAWMIEHGFIESTACVLHRCDNPPCVNPAHLFIGDRAANRRDCVAKGRHIHGERAWNARFTAAQVRKIRERARLGDTYAVLAKRFRTNRGYIGRLVRGVRWKYLDMGERAA